MYILFEGIDTSGKSTQISLLANKIPKAVVTKEPGGTDIGIKLRDILLNGELHSSKAQMYLFLADRAEHTNKVVKPNQDRVILSDRGFVSGMAYALANGEYDIEFLYRLNSDVMDGILPTHIIFFKLSKEVIIDRLSTKDQDAIESRGIDYLLSVQKEIESVVNFIESKGVKVLKLNGSLSIKELHTKICKFVGVDR